MHMRCKLASFTYCLQATINDPYFSGKLASMMQL